MTTPSPGRRFREAISAERPLQVVGAINAYCALLAEHTGFRALYLSGAGVANASYGLPDLGITTLADVLEDVRRITRVTTLPLLVDIDTGWGSAFNIARAIRDLTLAGAAGIHIEDQVQAKRCGHRPNKALVPTDEMADRITAAVDARTDPEFVIIARTDALAREGLDAAVERARRYAETGADIIFPEAVTELAHYRVFAEATGRPILANITEFGLTPLFTTRELADAGVSLAIYPVTAFRAMSATALRVYEALRATGTQRDLIPQMQTRHKLYDILGYDAYEHKLDELFAREQRDEKRDEKSRKGT
ncbi:MAG: methylisocitrate lyase [Nitrososphaerota archaeon]